MKTTNLDSSIPHESNSSKPAAIWARVSTSNQAETSLPSQIARCKENLEQAGFKPIRTFSVSFSSLDLYSCPQFQELRKLIHSGTIQALAVYDRDRLAAQGLQRLMFLSELKDAGVELIVCEGAPIIDGPEGQIVELALAISKERQVLRARQGAKDGLHDRATLRKLPVSYHKVYGYQWDKSGGHPRLIPNGSYDNLKLIFDLVLDGNGYNKVIAELKKRVIPSPSGNPEWNKAALTTIIHNPIYAGRYFALKNVAVKPKEENRKGNTYGNSTVRRKPLAEATYIPEIEILNPPITWEQRGQIFKQLEKHQKLANRNAKRNYLLRGLVFCETHRRKNGEPRRYHGRPQNNRWRYTCPVGKCYSQNLDGPELENFLTNEISSYFLFSPKENYANLLTEANIEETVKSFHSEIDKLRKEDSLTIDKMATLEDRYLGGNVGDAVHNQLSKEYEQKRESIAMREDEILSQMGLLNRQKDAKETLASIKVKYSAALRVSHEAFLADGSTARPKELVELWRELLVAMNTELHIHPLDTEGPNIYEATIKGRNIKWELRCDLPIGKTEDSIASVNP